MSSVAVVVLNFNAEEKTIECLDSLARQTYQDITPIIVDNASTHTTQLRDYTAAHQIAFLQNPVNTGFAGGVNTGIRHALEHKYDFVTLLNNDALPAPDWIEQLVSCAHDTKSDIVTGLMLHSSGKTIDSTGEQYSVWGLPFPRDRNRPVAHAAVSGPTFGATGGGTLYNAKVFREIGLFDETFFAYLEDVDISFRAQLAGLKMYYCAEAVLYHEQGGTFNKYPAVRTMHYFKNLPLVYIKNIPAPLLLPVGARLIIAYTLIFFKAIIHGGVIPALKGWLWQIPLFWFHALPARHKIQRDKKVGDDYIKSILWPDLPPDQTGLRKFRSLFTGKK